MDIYFNSDHLSCHASFCT